MRETLKDRALALADKLAGMPLDKIGWRKYAADLIEAALEEAGERMVNAMIAQGDCTCGVRDNSMRREHETSLDSIRDTQDAKISPLLSEDQARQFMEALREGKDVSLTMYIEKETKFQPGTPAGPSASPPGSDQRQPKP